MMRRVATLVALVVALGGAAPQQRDHGHDKVRLVPAESLLGLPAEVAGRPVGTVLAIRLDPADGHVAGLDIGRGAGNGDHPLAMPWRRVRAIGRRVVTLAPGEAEPAPEAAGQLVIDRAGSHGGGGSDRVVGLHGERVGLVDQVMIDPAAGRAAYVLVRTGGFLGLGAQWTPIPFAALRYDPAGPDWVLAEMPPASLAAAPQRSELPTEVDRQDLADLYRRYGADPYWH